MRRNTFDGPHGTLMRPRFMHVRVRIDTQQFCKVKGSRVGHLYGSQTAAAGHDRAAEIGQGDEEPTAVTLKKVFPSCRSATGSVSRI